MVKCMFCGHDAGEHEPVGVVGDGNGDRASVLLECVVEGCRCEVEEDRF